MSVWNNWLGRTQTAVDRLDLTRAERWAATFDRAVPGDWVMPQGIHFCLCTPDAPSDMLGEDGHPLRDDSANSFLPPVPLPRRMWASSAITFKEPIAVDAVIERTSRVLSVKEKTGGSGTLVFVEVDHVTKADGRHAVQEQQTLVYRAAAAPDAPLAPPEPETASFDPENLDPTKFDAYRVLTPDPRLLFRYSALTFNTHRIHYDAPYARDVERYRGLVVHGPLTASLLLQLAGATWGENRLARFSFRGESPAIAGEPLHLMAQRDRDTVEFAALAQDGRKIMAAHGILAPQ